MIPGSMSATVSFRCAGVLTFLLCFGTVGSAPHFQQGILLPLQATVPDTANQPPKLLDTTELPKPRVRAGAAIVYNPATHEILWESNGFQRRPIASITKVMTALVFLEQEHDLRSDVVISRRDVRRASTTYLRRGERISLYNLLHLALVASDNAAARSASAAAARSGAPPSARAPRGAGACACSRIPLGYRWFRKENER